MVNRIDSFNCNACGICAVVCPKNAISFSYNSGFPIPVIDETSCNNCGACAKFCTKDKEIDLRTNVQCYAAWSNNSVSQKASTSGGFAYEAARYLVGEKGYLYVGVEMKVDGLYAEAYIAESVEELEKSRGSKYINAHMMPALERIRENQKWVIVGTPCQIVAYDNYFRAMGRRDNVILIDMFCAGPANELLLKKYVEEKCNEVSKKNTDIAEIRFRDKSEIGWSSTMKVLFKDGSSTVYKSSVKDEFFSVFYSRACQKDSCYKCVLDTTRSKADIRIGDFWGERFKGNKDGVSAVIVFTNRGQTLVKDLSRKSIDLIKVNSEEIFIKQLEKPQRMPRQRDKVLMSIYNDTTLEEIQKKYIKPIRFERRVRNRIKIICSKSCVGIVRKLGKKLRT